MLKPGWLTAHPFAHRGLHDKARGLVENSPSAARAAIAGGFGIECDVQLTAEGEAVIFHDFTLDRLTHESGPVAARTVQEITALSYRDSADQIPTLEAFLDLIGGRVPLLIEIKSRFDGNLRLAERVAAVLKERGDIPVAVMSFDDEIVAALARLVPDRPRGIVAEAHYKGAEWDKLDPVRKQSLSGLLHVAQSKPDFIAWNVHDLPHPAPNMARYLGMPVLTWTVRSPENRARAASHADQMIFEGFDPRQG